MQTACWLFWRFYYFVADVLSALRIVYPDRSFGNYMRRAMRTVSPWRTWRPCVWRNEDLSQWEIWLEDEPSYGSHETVNLLIRRSPMDNRVVGLVLHDGFAINRKISQ